jgi:beta-lactamase class A
MPFKYIDPLIAVSSPDQVSPEYANLQKAVQSFIDSQKKSGTLSAASLVFRDMQASEGFTVNPTEKYNPASLNKVPLMMAYYKLAEANPPILEKRLTYTGAYDLDARENIKAPVQLKPRTSYTVGELIEHMIRYSDNNALKLLFDDLQNSGHGDVLTALLTYLGMTYGTNTDYLSIQSYALFFRSLYNATYLDPEFSEKAMELLTRSDFSEGIQTGIPNHIPLAEKYGDSNIVSSAGVQMGKELHNCGIVFYPNHPYLLCVMTKGKDIQSLENVIATISRVVYQEQESRYR